MTVIDIEQATPGMTVAKNIIAPGGAVLLPKGACLTADIINTLQDRGITQLSADTKPVKAKPYSASGMAPDPDLNSIEERFADVLEDEIMQTVLAAVKEYIVEKGC